MNETEELLLMLGFSKEAIGNNVSNLNTEEVITSDSNDIYYQKGERILTLARTKQGNSSYAMTFKKDDILELNYPFNKIQEKEALKCFKTISTFFKKRLSSMDNTEKLIKEGIPFLYDMMSSYKNELIISVVPNSERCAYGASLASSVGRGSQSLIFQIDGKRDNPFFGPVNTKHKHVTAEYFFKSDPKIKEFIIDTTYFFTTVSILNRVHLLFTEIRNKKDYKNPLFVLSEKLLNPFLEINWEIGSTIVSDTFSKFLLNHEYYLDMDTLTYKKPGNVRSLCYDEIFKKNSEFYHLKHFFRLIYEGRRISLESLFETRKDCITVNYNAVSITHCLTIFLQAATDLYYYKDELKYKTKLKGKVATAYITKKNIPCKILNAMKQSKFNHTFGYIEFDENVNLESIKLIEDEFMKLSDKIFHGCIFHQVILRFRKLGKHKAAGLYYPFLNTLCVDIRYPSSFMHEYFHMIDDQLDHLSISHDFYEIVTLYRQTLQECVHSLDPETKKVLNGRGTYNLAYFFRPAEIFARCGEMYLDRILCIESSILKHPKDHDFAYPKSEKLDSMIQKYFNEVLENMAKREETCTKEYLQIS